MHEEVERPRELRDRLGVGTEFLVALGGTHAGLDRLGVAPGSLQVKRGLPGVAADRGDTFAQQLVGDPAVELAACRQSLCLVRDLPDQLMAKADRVVPGRMDEVGIDQRAQLAIELVLDKPATRRRRSRSASRPMVAAACASLRSTPGDVRRASSGSRSAGGMRKSA